MTPRVFLAIPLNREIQPDVLDSIMHMAGGYVTNVHVDSAPAKYLDDKRNESVEKFLETDCTHLLLCDSDTLTDIKALARLLEHDVPVVSAVIYKKGGDHEPCFGYWDPLRRLYSTPIPFKYNELLKVDIVGTGFLLVRRDVFDLVEFPWFECVDKMQAGEDVFFSLKCKEAGIDVYVDTSLHLGHVATPYLITNETYEMHMFWKIIKDITAAGRIAEFSKILVDFTQKPYTDILERQDPEKTVKAVATRFSYDASPIIRETYLDYVKNFSKPDWAIGWEMVCYLDRLMQQMKPKRILDIGSGYSSFLFRLSHAEVFSVDASTEWLAKTREFLIKNEKEHENLSTSLDFQGKFDIILLDYDVGKNTADKDRISLFSKVRAACSGVIIFDDMQAGDYREAVRSFFKDDIIFDLKNETLDRYDRYAWMVIPHNA